MLKQLKRLLATKNKHGNLSSAPVQLIAHQNEQLKEVSVESEFRHLTLEESRLADAPSLIKIAQEDLYDNKERAKIALLVGTAHLQHGNISEAKLFLDTAQKWGCSKSEIAKLLIAEVHHSLGKAAAIRQEAAKAREQFEKAVILKNGGADARLLTQARLTHNLSEQGLSDFVAAPFTEQKTRARKLELAHQTANDVVDSISKNQVLIFEKLNEILKTIEIQNVSIAQLKNETKSVVKNESFNIIRQIEFFLSLQAFLNNQTRVPELHGWPISPDLGVFMIDLIEKNGYDLIIEFGSGTSTALIGTALSRINVTTAQANQPKQVSFEHLQQYLEKTSNELELLGVRDSVELKLAPLIEYVTPEKETFPYYDCEITLAQLASTSPRASRILVFVDGPPSSTGPLARYPALPVVLKAFPNSCIDIVLDDYDRDDEKAVVERWRSQLSDKNYIFTVEAKKMEKHVCFINIKKTEITV